MTLKPRPSDPPLPRREKADHQLSLLCPLCSTTQVTYDNGLYERNTFPLVSECVYSLYSQYFRCYTDFCNPPQSVTQGGAVEYFLKHTWVWSVDRHEVVYVSTHAQAWNVTSVSSSTPWFDLISILQTHAMDQHAFAGFTKLGKKSQWQYKCYVLSLCMFPHVNDFMHVYASNSCVLKKKTALP